MITKQQKTVSNRTIFNTRQQHLTADEGRWRKTEYSNAGICVEIGGRNFRQIFILISSSILISKCDRQKT